MFSYFCFKRSAFWTGLNGSIAAAAWVSLCPCVVQKLTCCPYMWGSAALLSSNFSDRPLNVEHTVMERLNAYFLFSCLFSGSMCADSFSHAAWFRCCLMRYSVPRITSQVSVIQTDRVLWMCSHCLEEPSVSVICKMTSLHYRTII